MFGSHLLCCLSPLVFSPPPAAPSPASGDSFAAPTASSAAAEAATPADAAATIASELLLSAAPTWTTVGQEITFASGEAVAVGAPTAYQVLFLPRLFYYGYLLQLLQGDPLLARRVQLLYGALQQVFCGESKSMAKQQQPQLPSAAEVAVQLAEAINFVPAKPLMPPPTLSCLLASLRVTCPPCGLKGGLRVAEHPDGAAPAEGVEDEGIQHPDETPEDGGLLLPWERELLQQDKEPAAEASGSACSHGGNSNACSSVPLIPGVGFAVAVSTEGLTAVLSAVARCVACIAPPVAWLAETEAASQTSLEVAKMLSLWTAARDSCLPTLESLLQLLFAALHTLMPPLVEELNAAEAALTDLQGLFWIGFRRSQLQQMLLLTAARTGAVTGGACAGVSLCRGEARGVEVSQRRFSRVAEATKALAAAAASCPLDKATVSSHTATAELPLLGLSHSASSVATVEGLTSIRVAAAAAELHFAAATAAGWPLAAACYGTMESRDEGQKGLLGIATGQLTMGPSESVVADAAAPEEGGGGEEGGAGDVLRVWRQIRDVLTSQLLQQLAAAEPPAADVLGAATASIPSGAPSAAPGNNTENFVPLLALRKHQTSVEAVRMEELSELLSVVSRASLSASLVHQGAAAEAANALSMQAADPMALQAPTTAAESPCALDGVTSSATGALAAEADPANDRATDALTPCPNTQAYSRVPRSLFALQGGRLLRLLLFVERLLKLHLATAAPVYRQLERVLALPCRRLLEVSLELLQHERLAAVACGGGTSGGNATAGTDAGGAAAAAGDAMLQQEIAKGLLHVALRLTTEIARESAAEGLGWLALARQLLRLCGHVAATDPYPLHALFNLMLLQSVPIPWKLKPRCPPPQENKSESSMGPIQEVSAADDAAELYSDLQGPVVGGSSAHTSEATEAGGGLAGADEVEEDPRRTLLRPLQRSLLAFLSQCELLLSAQQRRGPVHAARLLRQTRLALLTLDSAKALEKAVLELPVEAAPLVRKIALLATAAFSPEDRLASLAAADRQRRLLAAAQHFDVAFLISLRRTNYCVPSLVSRCPPYEGDCLPWIGDDALETVLRVAAQTLHLETSHGGAACAAPLEAVVGIGEEAPEETVLPAWLSDPFTRLKAIPLAAIRSINVLFSSVLQPLLGVPTPYAS
ncbi:hypothetical protein cyc_08735 [Cyclospora cayetanensis]|uniref:Uncharacterized protein n=1 Tax=Cyclospora cayetanensis TaxID=88456 RepID=A0A1D3D9W5_9EIME|nr:hypothetical protein cyc_08735 [Cyclospora cayetanensis]